MLGLLLASAALLAYTFAGYPVLLRALVWLRGAKPIRRQDITPHVSLVISAYNEADVIRGKLANALALDYPRDRLQIAVVSDASSDDTDAIVREYASQGVVLFRQTERRGKTAGLNNTLPRLAGDIVVFSDANAMYEPDAIRKLVRNFADPEVGFVTGEARYVEGGEAAADRGERAYWDYEIQVKRLETALGSMVGGDGAIYAIRRELWRTLPDNAINDFLNPLQIIEAGWRGVYEPDAICYEETAGQVKSEYRRRIRIVSRSWRAVFQASGVLNPFRVGIFAWCLFSHKILRWWSGLIALAGGLAALVLVFRLAIPRPVLSAAIVLAGGLTCLASPTLRRRLAMIGYFAVLNVASLVGVLKGSTGRVSGIWSTPREHTRHRSVLAGVAFPLGQCFLLLGVAFCVFTATSFVGWHQAIETVFWTAVAALAYVYFAYPVLLFLLRLVARPPATRAPIEPTVCLLIAANDEESVIESKLRNTLALDYPPDKLDIVVASDGSVDRTNTIVRGFAPRVRLDELIDRTGKIAAINRSMAAVTAEIVVFSDANTFLDPQALRHIVARFADPSVGGVSGDVTLLGDRAALARSEDLYYLYERWIQNAESELGSMIGADGALYAIRRSLFVAPAGDTILDDMAIPMSVVRAGYRVVYEPLARAHEQGSETAREEFARKTRVVAGAVQFLSRHDSSVPLGSPQVMFSLISHKALRWLSPAFATSALVTSLFLAGESTLYTAAAVAQVWLVSLGLAGCLPALRKHGIVALAHYFCLVQAAAAVGFVRGLSGRQSVRWRRFIRMPVKQSEA